MFLRNSVYPVTHDGALFVQINGDQDHVSRYKFYDQKAKIC